MHIRAHTPEHKCPGTWHIHRHPQILAFFLGTNFLINSPTCTFANQFSLFTENPSRKIIIYMKMQFKVDWQRISCYLYSKANIEMKAPFKTNVLEWLVRFKIKSKIWSQKTNWLFLLGQEQLRNYWSGQVPALIYTSILLWMQNIQSVLHLDKLSIFTNSNVTSPSPLASTSLLYPHR